MQIISHKKFGSNVHSVEQAISLVGGSVLVAAGIAKRSWTGLALALIGGDLMRRGITGRSYAYELLGIRTAPKGQGHETTSVPYELGIRVDRSITIARPRADVFAFWRDFNNLSRFMDHVESVRQLDDKQSHWVVKAPAGRTVEWDAVIHNEINGELLAWRTLPGADVDHAGSVWFKEAPAGRGTEVKVELQYNPPAGAVGAMVAKLWGKEPSQQIESDLRRLKQILETGEVLTTSGQASGREDRGLEPHRERQVQHASEASFPASDAPAYTH
jgi:uncharacterized membrane protein